MCFAISEARLEWQERKLLPQVSWSSFEKIKLQDHKVRQLKILVTISPDDHKVSWNRLETSWAYSLLPEGHMITHFPNFYRLPLFLQLQDSAYTAPWWYFWYLMNTLSTVICKQGQNSQAN